VGLITFMFRRPELSRLAPQSYVLARPMHPDMGWMMLLIAVIYLLYAMIPSRSDNFQPGRGVSR
jgi:hypothetical protein